MIRVSVARVRASSNMIGELEMSVRVNWFNRRGESAQVRDA